MRGQQRGEQDGLLICFVCVRVCVGGVEFKGGEGWFASTYLSTYGDADRHPTSASAHTPIHTPTYTDSDTHVCLLCLPTCTTCSSRCNASGSLRARSRALSRS